MPRQREGEGRDTGECAAEQHRRGERGAGAAGDGKAMPIACSSVGARQGPRIPRASGQRRPQDGGRDDRQTDDDPDVGANALQPRRAIDDGHQEGPSDDIADPFQEVGREQQDVSDRYGMAARRRCWRRQ